jgi:hypothetical protein
MSAGRCLYFKNNPLFDTRADSTRFHSREMIAYRA